MNNGEVISTVEKEFAIEAVRNGVRLDGRRPQDSRRAEVRLGPKYGQSEITLGQTRVFSTVTVIPVIPRPSRASEGILTFSVEISAAAAERYAQQFALGGMAESSGEEAMEVRGIVERVIRDSNAVDTEALCVLAGKIVWKVVVDVVVVNHCGNVIDACVMAAMAALLYARRPEFTITGQDVVVHTEDEREPVPLAIQHVPFSVSFAVFAGGELAAIDPVRKEEIAADGALTLSMNANGEVCGLHKAGGAPLDPKLVIQCARFAETRVVELSKLMNKAMDEEAAHHPLAIVKPILVAPEPTAVLNKRQKVGDHQGNVESARKMSSFQKTSQWNATPAFDDAPPAAAPKLEDDEMMIIDKSPINGTTTNARGTAKSQSVNRKSLVNRNGHAAKSTAEETKSNAVQTPSKNQEFDSSSSSDSDDDLVNAILTKHKRKQRGAKGTRK